MFTHTSSRRCWIIIPVVVLQFVISIVLIKLNSGPYQYVTTWIQSNSIWFHEGVKTNLTNQHQISVNKTFQPPNNRTPIILFWSTYYGQSSWFQFKKKDFGKGRFQHEYCKYKDCILTKDKNQVDEADVLLFYFADRWPILKKTKSNQFYAHLILEPPGTRLAGSHTFLDAYQGLINIAVNFRKDADLYIPYSKFVHMNSQAYVPKIPLANKTKMAVWPVSHCKTDSKREDYVKELSKYITVDIYGGCGKHVCPRSRDKECLTEWENNYKFYISFENNICDDYITEKMFQPLEHELIPVVLGGGNYTRDAPPHSVIDARDFNSPKDLASFLLALSEDELRYHKYFSWKSNYKQVGVVDLLFCDMCEALHENTLPVRSTIANYADYWFGKNGERCQNNLVPRMRQKGGW